MKKTVILLWVLLFLIVGMAMPACADVTLEVIWMGWPKDMVMQLINEFQGLNPGIKVDIQLIPYPQLFPTLEVRLAAGGTPDAYLVDGPLTASYAARKYLLPLDDYFSSKELKAWFPASIQAATYKGKVYSIPYATSCAGLYYNKKILQKAGIPFPSEKPSERLTWEQVADMARKLTIDENKDGQTDVWGFMMEQMVTPYQFLPLPQSNRAKVISKDGLKTSGYIDSRPFIEAAQFYWKLYNEWKVSPVGIPDAAKSREYFGNGKVALMLGAEWNISRLAAFKDLEFGLAPHPYFKGGVPVTPTGSWHVGVNSRTAHKEEAVKYVKYITGFEASTKWHKLFGHAPARPDVYKAVPESFNKPMWDIFFYEMENTAVARPATPGYSEYEQILREALGSISYGADPEKTLNETAQRIDRELRKYR
jgi:fructooligosaccharide transport system substrate-binding protein